MRLKHFFVFYPLVFLLTACTQTFDQNAMVNSNPSTTISSDSANEIKIFAKEEITTHNTQNDCWLIIHDQVYDITSFIDVHPGGKAIIQGCGKDATTLFENRPESGTAHSQKAIDLMPKYLIGKVK